MKIYHKCARWTCSDNCRSLGFVSNNRQDKINFIKDGLSKGSLDNLLLTLETHPSGDVHIAIRDLWPKFQKECNKFSLENLTLKDPVCQFIRKLDRKRILDSQKAFKPFLDVKPEEDVSHNHSYLFILMFYILISALFVQKVPTQVIFSKLFTYLFQTLGTMSHLGWGEGIFTLSCKKKKLELHLVDLGLDGRVNSIF